MQFLIGGSALQKKEQPLCIRACATGGPGRSWSLRLVRLETIVDAFSTPLVHIAALAQRAIRRRECFLRLIPDKVSAVRMFKGTKPSGRGLHMKMDG